MSIWVSMPMCLDFVGRPAEIFEVSVCHHMWCTCAYDQLNVNCEVGALRASRNLSFNSGRPHGRQCAIDWGEKCWRPLQGISSTWWRCLMFLQSKLSARLDGWGVKGILSIENCRHTARWTRGPGLWLASRALTQAYLWLPILPRIFGMIIWLQHWHILL